MIRRHPDAIALAVLGLALASGLPVPNISIPDTGFRTMPALLASTGPVDRLLERFEDRRGRVWERLDRRMREFEQRLTERESRRRIRTARS